MKRSLSSAALFYLFSLILICPNAHGGDIRHTMGGEATNSFYVDDRGGSVNNGGSDNSYYLNLLDIDQSAFGTLLLYADDGIEASVDDGLVDEDFTEPSGINLYDLSVLPGTVSPGEIGLSSDAPLTPVFFEASQSGLIVEQVSYTSANPGENFVILEFRVLNPTSGDVDALLALANDFDVDLKSSDAVVGYDDSGVPTVYQQESLPLDPNHTTVGVSILHGSEAQYRLEICSGNIGACEIFADDNDLIRQAFFEGAVDQVGDLTEGATQQDFAVTIAADLGTIPPGGAGDVVFCYTPAGGESPNDALLELLAGTEDCGDFYDDEIKVCGNGLINFDEDCDDGDEDLSDSCPDGPEGSCIPAFCGDGFEWTTDGGDEACDDGNDNTHDSCPSGPTGTCQDASCGDGFLWNDGGNEQCDDGNNVTTDACPSGPTGICQTASCGDGFIYDGVEDCDDGNNDVTDACPSGPSGTCEPAFCGDGFIRQGVEDCDDGNLSTTDACPSGPSGTCELAFCGDGYIHQGVEVCDTAISGPNCADNCTRFDSCGNGSLEPGEQCDDGNENTSDACPSGPSGTCQNAQCGDGYLRVGVEECDDGNKINGDGCNASCESEGGGFQSPPTDPVCGNGIVEDGEECDDGNTNDFDGCWSDCRFELVLQGGGTSTNRNPEDISNGCSLGGRAGPPVELGWLLPVLLGFLVRRERRKQCS